MDTELSQIKKRNKWIIPDGIGHPAYYADREEGIYIIRQYSYPPFKNAEIIYVGRSANLRNRLFNHEILKMFYKKGIPCYIKFKHCNNSEELEKYFIKRLKPEYNYQHNDEKQKETKKISKEQMKKYGYHY